MLPTPDGARELVAQRLGLDFPARRSADLERGLARAARAEGFRTVAEYVSWLRPLPAASADWHRLAGELTVGESYFFRDRATHDALRQHVIPELIAARRAAGALRLRLWSAGCSTGEEAYSLAILVHRLLPERAKWRATILGTDIDARALEAARRGIYRQWSLRGIPDWVRPHFARRAPNRFELAPEIRRMVTFAPLNLMSGSYPAPATGTDAMDVILCRNVLMYLTREAQRATVERLKRALVDGGWLLVSPAEASTDLLRPLAPVYFAGAVLRRKQTTGVPSSPMAVRRDATVGVEPGGIADRAVPAPLSAVERARAEADLGRLERAGELCRAALEQDRLDQPVAAGEGMTAGVRLATARAHLALAT